MEQRAVIKFNAKLGKSASETFRSMQQVYGSQCLGRAAVFEWHKRFLEGRETLEDDKKSGRPILVRTPEMIEKVRDFVANDRNASLKMMKEALNISRETIRTMIHEDFHILHEDLGKTKVCAKFVSHTLRSDQKSARMTYKQIFGTAMDSPLSPIMVNIVMQDLEEIAINKLLAQPLFYFRYVDDIILAFPSDTINDALNIFNSLHMRLQFILEVGTGGKLSFLDTMLVIDDQRIIFDIYHKKTFSGRFLNFHSNHSLCHKKGTIISFIDKIIILSHPRFQQKNLIDAIHIFLNNCYPLSFIFSTIEQRLKFHILKFHIINILHFSIPNTLKGLIKKGKDKLDIEPRRFLEDAGNVMLERVRDTVERHGSIKRHVVEPTLASLEEVQEQLVSIVANSQFDSECEYTQFNAWYYFKVLREIATKRAMINMHSMDNACFA
ncbi:SETMR methyltransferase, partial [Acromyrmex heyeri]